MSGSMKVFCVFQKAKSLIPFRTSLVKLKESYTDIHIQYLSLLVQKILNAFSYWPSKIELDFFQWTVTWGLTDKIRIQNKHMSIYICQAGLVMHFKLMTMGPVKETALSIFCQRAISYQSFSFKGDLVQLIYYISFETSILNFACLK